MTSADMDPSLALVRREAAFRLLVPLFFLSGATSLVYESLWGRTLHLVFGTSQVGIATVLAAFMGGLSLGGFAMGRVADRVRRPLLIYGVLEGVIGLWALVLPFLLDAVVPLYLASWRHLEPSPLVFAGIQALVVGVLLLVPTTCMGATLPLLSRFATTRLDLAGRRVGLLYAVNTFGAVAGVGLAGFVFLPRWGLHQTTLITAAANLVLGVLAALLSRRTDGAAPPAVEAVVPEPPPAPDRTILLVAGLSGFAALACELAWFRLMTLTLGGSAYAFSIMLLAFLAGMALGGGVGGAWADALLARGGRTRLLRGLALTLFGVAVLTYAAVWGYGQLPYLYVDLYTAVEGRWAFFWPAQLLLAGGVMTPPAILMGMAFTLAVRSLVADPERLGAPVGTVYGVNTVGGILGVLLAAFVMLPRLQVVGTVLVAAGVYAGAGLLAWRAAAAAAGEARGRRLLPVTGAVGLAVGLAVVFPPRWEPLLMTAGMYKYVTELASRTRAHVRAYAVGSYELLYYAEGLSSVVTVARNRKTGNIWLANNGKVDASTTTDMPTQLLVGHLPFFYRPEARTACVVGLASGVTAGAVTLHPSLESIDLVELEPAILEASRFFDEVNHRPLEDPRVRTVVNDARNHMLLTPPGTYDVVVSEPSNPWLTGVSNLFTLEFFQEGRKRLAPGGVWSQWIQMYGMGTEELRALLNTFGQVFPYVVVYATIEDADLVVLGSDAPLDLDLAVVPGLIEARPGVASDLATAEIHDVFDLVTYLQMSREALDEFVQGAALNTDDNMLVEFMAPRRLYEETSTGNFRIMLHQAEPATRDLRDLDDYRALARAYARRKEWVRALIVLKAAEGRWPGDPEVEELYLAYQAEFRAEQT